MAAILEDEDVDSLEVDIDLMEAERVPLRKAYSNEGIVNIAITSLKSAGRNLDVMGRHNYLIMVLLPRVVLLRVLHLLFLSLLRLYYRKRSMIDSDS